MRVKIFIGMLLGVLLTLGGQSVEAASGAEFVLKPAPTAAQNAANEAGYFDLQVKPGDKGTVSVLVQNQSTDTARTITVSPVSATTNDVAQIDYTPSSRRPNASAPFQFTSMFSRPTTVTLQPNEGKVVSFEYVVPEKAFQGQVLGSIYAIDQTKTTATKGELANQFASAIAVVFSEQTKDQLAPAKPVLDVAKLQVVRNQPGVGLRISNDRPRYIPNMTFDATITNRGTKKQVAQSTAPNASLAPNSSFTYHLATGGRTLPAGRYRAQVTIKAKDKTWHLVKDFTVSNDDLQASRKQVYTPNPFWWWWIVLLVLLGILFIFWLIWRRKRQKDDPEA